MKGLIMQKVVSKTEVNAMIKALKDAGLEVTETPTGGYKCVHNDSTVWSAIKGAANKYLVKYDSELFN